MSPSTKRCFGEGLEYYEKYHDHEWGIPVYDDQKLFELLCLEGAQAGLNWALVLKKRKDYQTAYHQFDPHVVAQMSDEELYQLIEDSNLIRNRLKIFSVRKNALAFLEIQKEFGSFSDYLWSHVDHKPIINEFKEFAQVPCLSPLSEHISKDLKKRGMTFVGPKIIYSFLQAVGVVNDHLVDCPHRFPTSSKEP